MNESTIEIAGIPIPSSSPIFLAVLGVHVLFGVWCVGVGAADMLSRKQAGQHTRFGVGMAVVAGSGLDTRASPFGASYPSLAD